MKAKKKTGSLDRLGRRRKGPNVAAMEPAALRRIRQSLGLTQTQMAERLGVQMLQVSRWERGDTPISKGRAMAVVGLQGRMTA